MRPFAVALAVAFATLLATCAALTIGQAHEQVSAGQCYTVYAGTGPNPPYVTVCPPVL